MYKTKFYRPLRAVASFSLLSALAVFASCDDLKDDDYYSNDHKQNTNDEVVKVAATSYDYIASRSDLSDMMHLFETQGIFDKLSEKGQLHTMLVVTNDHFVQPDEEEAEYIANSHVTDIKVASAALENGQRLLMWHNKYVTVTTDEEAQSGNIIGHIMFNNASLNEVVETTDGYIYVISDMIYTPTSLQDYINSLEDDKYSLFKDMVLSSGGREFDKANSKIVGVDPDGNTVYDSVFIYTNEFFDAKNFDLSSEALQATMLVFDNDVIAAAMKDADQKLRSWGYRMGDPGTPGYIEGRSDSVLQRWILEVAFYRESYSAADLKAKPVTDDPTINDIKSIYDRQWRTSVQSLDLANPMSLSNGVAYNVTSFRFPTNVLIYRLKEEFYYYNYCDADQKPLYFKMDNLVFSKTDTEVAAWTPAPGVWPLHSNTVLILKSADASKNYFQFDFTPIQALSDGNGGYAVSPKLVPPGTYRLAMGFKQNMGVTMDISLWLVDGPDTLQIADPTPVATDGTAGTNYHYDRGATLPNTYPEGYDKSGPYIQGDNAGKAQNYDTDGGIVYPEIEVPDLYNDGRAFQLLLRMRCNDLQGKTSFTFNHWCLRPTANNY